MTTHRFTINVPNPSDRAVVANLRLDKARRRRLEVPLDVPREPLEVVSSGLSLDACATKGTRRLVVELGPLESIDVHVIAETGAGRRPGSAEFHMSDERDGVGVGGVTVVCVERAGPDHPGSVVASPNACPAAAAGDAYVVPVGGDPAAATARSIAVGASVELVVPITNPTRAALPDLQVYLEHLGLSGAGFRPTTWRLGDLAPRDVFLASWEVDASGGAAGAFHASVVALSEKHDPVRLQVPFSVEGTDRRR